MKDFCWYLQRESNGLSYKRKAKCSKAISQVILGNKLHLLSVAVVSLLRNGKF